MLKKLTALVALILLLFSVAAVQADSTYGDVFCGDLSDADCQILLDNAAVMDEVHSLSFTAHLEFELGGAGFDEHFLMSGSGSGRLAFDRAAAAALEDPESYADAAGMAALMESLFSSMAGEFTFDLTGETAEDDVSLQFNMIMQEGVVVLDGASLEALTGESMGEVQWLGFDTTGVFEDIIEDAGMDEEGMASLAAMEAAEYEVTTITRLPEEVVGGVTVAVFQSSIDLNAILSGLTLEDLRAESRPDQKQDVELVYELMQGIEVRDFSNRQYIGIDDRYTYRMEVSMDMLMGGKALGLDDRGLEMTMRLDMHLSDFNQPVNVTIPEDAFILPLAMLMQMGS